MIKIILSKRERQLIDKLSNDFRDGVAMDLQPQGHWYSVYDEIFQLTGVPTTISGSLIYRFVGLIMLNKNKFTKTLLQKVEDLIKEYGA